MTTTTDNTLLSRAVVAEARVAELLTALKALVKAINETEQQWGKHINLAIHALAIDARDVIAKVEVRAQMAGAAE